MKNQKTRTLGGNRLLAQWRVSWLIESSTSHDDRKNNRRFDLPVANKVLMYGPFGCGKTLTSYVLAGELKKMMVVINLWAIVSSKFGVTSKNLSKIFKKAAVKDYM